jgi:hypothetical protein
VSRALRDLGDAGTVGLQIVFSLAACFVLGRWADARWGGGRGWFTAIGVVYGVAATVKIFIDTHRKMQRQLAALEAEEAAARQARESKRP